jgi:hypothetical protein
MLRRLKNVRLVALLVYALVVHAVVWSVGAAHATDAAGLVWCGKSAKPSVPLAPSHPVDDDAACKLACGTTFSAAEPCHSNFSNAAPHDDTGSYSALAPIDRRASAQPRGPPDQV